MSHILIVGCGPAGISAALRLASRGQQVTLASASPPIYHRCAGLPGIDLPEDAAQELRAMGAQSLSGHEVMHAFSRQLLQYESNGTLRFLPYHRLLRLAVGDGRCVGGVLLNERAGKLESLGADAVLLATGGMHTMFSENRFGCDGLAAALAFQAGAALRNPDQINTSGRYPIFEGGLITSWDGETTVPGLYAAGECADGTAVSFPFSQAMATGTAAADYLCESLPETDPLEAGCAIAETTNAAQQLLDVFRQTQGTRAPAAVERRIRETVQRTMTGKRTARLLQRGLLDIRVMRQQAARGEYDLGEGLYPVLRLPGLLHLLEVMLTTAAYRLMRQDGDLTAVLRDGKIEVTAKRSAAVEAAAYMPETSYAAENGEEHPDPANAARNELIGVGSALQSAAANEFAAKYNLQPPTPSRRARPRAAEPAPPLEQIPVTSDTVSFQPLKMRQTLGDLAAAHASGTAKPMPPFLSAAPAQPEAAPSPAPAPAGVTVTAAETVLDPTPAPEPAAEAAADVRSSEKVLEFDLPHAEGPAAGAETHKPRADAVFTPDPEALLALAVSRKARAESESPSGRAHGDFRPDPESLLTFPDGSDHE